jgi:ATP-dependent DNA helicase RecQ
MLENQLQKYFEFNSFKKGQEEVILKIMKGQSAAAIFPTGAGKSLCYQLPAILLPGITLVVSPLLSLMKDQLDFLLEHNISAARLDSTLDRKEYNEVLEKAKNGQLKILMISVERFKNERFRYNLRKMNISLLVIDEAHCISEWGHNFRPEYLKLPVYQKEYGIKQVLLLTATATQQVVNDMCSKLNVPRENVIITGFYRENLFLQITPTKEAEKGEKLIQRIKESPKALTIVYVTLRKTAEKVAELLCLNEINAHPYHAGMKNEERERELIQNRFMSGELNCIVATIAFGMGIDKENVRRVIHYDLPKCIESYSQEIGRSGRDGEKSFCEVLANKDNVNILENFI